MNWSMITVSAAILLLAIGAILLSIIKVSVSFRMINLSECRGYIHIKAIYGLVIIKRSLDIKERLNHLISDEEQSAETINKWQGKIKKTSDNFELRDLKGPVLEALKKVNIHYFVWKSGAGTGDAAVTGRLAGAVWSIKGMIEAWIKQYIPMKNNPELTFVPFFQAQRFESELSCMVSIRTGKAILTIFRLYRKWKKLNNRRSGNNGTSNQGFNDDGDGKSQGNDRCEYDRRRSG